MIWILCQCPTELSHRRRRACIFHPAWMYFKPGPYADKTPPLGQAGTDTFRRDGWSGLFECCYRDAEGRKLMKLVLRDTIGGREMVVVHGGETRAGSRCAHNEPSAHLMTPHKMHQAPACARLELLGHTQPPAQSARHTACECTPVAGGLHRLTARHPAARWHAGTSCAR